MHRTYGSVEISLDTKRFKIGFKKAQRALNEAVARDTKEYVPSSSGALRNSVWFPGGIYGTEIEWNSVYARYQYYSVLMLGMESKSAWAKKGEKKALTDRVLHHPVGTWAWFKFAKEQHKKEWRDEAAKAMGLK